MSHTTQADSPEAEPGQDQTVSTAPTPNPFPLNAEQSLLILLWSVGAGLIADALLRGPSIALGWTLFSLCIIMSLYLLGKRMLAFYPSTGLLAPLVVLALLLSWRDASFLAGLNIAVQVLLFVLFAARASFQSLLKSDFAACLFNLIQAGFGFIGQPFYFLFRAPWKALTARSLGAQPVLFAILRGVMLSFPLLIIFMLLFASADARFEALIQPLLDWDISRIVNHSMMTTFFAALMLAFISQTALSTGWRDIKSSVPRALRLGRIETTLVFGSLALLFASFLLVQASYLFGGEGLVLSSDISYASYGRRGFFELVTVTVLLHSVLLFGLWLSAARGLYRILASVLVVMLYGVVGSALSRLGLYINVYGLTELRYYSTALILWIALAMLVFVLSLYLKRLPSLLASYLFLGLLGVLGLYISNPDARIAHTNIQRLDTQLALDTNYLQRLSQDAVVAIAAELDNVSDEDQALLLNLLASYQKKLTKDWRSWNVGQWQSRRILASILPAEDRPEEELSRGWRFD